MSKVVSSKEESGLNTFDNISQGDDDPVPKRRRGIKKDKPLEDTTETEDKPNKLKDKRGNKHGLKKEMTSVISRSDTEMTKEDLK